MRTNAMNLQKETQSQGTKIIEKKDDRHLPEGRLATLPSVDQKLITTFNKKIIEIRNWQSLTQIRCYKTHHQNLN